jgi:hypothetical protein
MKHISRFFLFTIVASTAALLPRTCEALPQPGYGSPQQQITCSSDDGRRNWCDIGGNSNIRLSRQISGTPCVQGDTWGIDNRGLWVDRGCRAEFTVASGYLQGQGSAQGSTVTCSSDDGRRNWCDVGGSRNIRLNRQLSGSPCVQGDTWGIDNRGLWVDRGCRAEFAVASGYFEGPSTTQGSTVTCSSDDGRRNWCDVGGSRNIRLSRQISGTPCIQGDTWGIDNRGL